MKKQRVCGAELGRLRQMVDLPATKVAERAGIDLLRLMRIEDGHAEPSLREVEIIFEVLASERERQLRSHHEYTR